MIPLENQKIRDLNIHYKILPIHFSKNEFELLIRANVIGSDGRVFPDVHEQRVGEIKKTRQSIVWLKWSTKYEHFKRVRVYKSFNASVARAAKRKLEEHISYLVAPQHLREVHWMDLGIKLCETVHELLTVHEVLDS